MLLNTLCVSAAAIAGGNTIAQTSRGSKSSKETLRLPTEDRNILGLKITATPELLDGAGSTVNVTWTGYSFGNPTDWVGMWCGTVPLEKAPIKYIEIGEETVNGSALFFVDNLRSSCFFGLVNGGAQFPLLQGRSNNVSFTDYDVPTGMRLAVTHTLGEMQVQWETSFTATTPHVQWGYKESEMTYNAAANTSTFNASMMCDQPAKNIGWHDPGALHVALMTGLTTGTTVFYRVGDEQRNVWSDVANFTVPPGPNDPQYFNFNFVAFGDMGQAGVNGAQQHSWDYDDHGEINALNTTRRIASDFHDKDWTPSLVVHIGDISYAVGFLAEWDQFVQQVTPIASRIPWMTGIGNHEMDFLGPTLATSSWIPGSDSGGECGVPYSSYYRMPAPANTGLPTAPWYQFTYGAVHFIIMSTEQNFLKGSVQNLWLQEALAKVDRTVTPYLVFGGHRPMYIDSAWFEGRYSDQSISNLLREHVGPYLIKAQVDLAMWGHHHSYQRTCPVNNITCTPNSPTHVVMGMAGYELTHDFTDYPPPYMEVIDDQHWGYTRTWVNSTHMTMQFIADDTGEIKDEFSLPNRFPSKK